MAKCIAFIPLSINLQDFNALQISSSNQPSLKDPNAIAPLEIPDLLRDRGLLIYEQDPGTLPGDTFWNPGDTY